jgi:hypothetical protein
MSTDVNVPMNPQQRDRDIDNKLRLYGIFQGFAHGHIPTNEQIDVALSSLIQHKKLTQPNNKLSDEGKTLLKEFTDVIEEAKRLVLTKNHGEVLQEFIWNARKFAESKDTINKPNKPVGKDEPIQDKERLANGLKTLGRLMVTNGQFRKLLDDATILLRDIAGDAAGKAASNVKPSQEQLDQIDRSAEPHEWHDAPGSFKQSIRDFTNRNKPIRRDDVRDVAGNAVQSADPHNSRDPRDVAQRTDPNDPQSSGVDPQTGLQTGKEQLKERLDQNVPEEHKERARQWREGTQNFLKSKMPRERREQTQWRLKKMIVEIQNHEDYIDAVNTLIELAKTYGGYSKMMARDLSGTVQEANDVDYFQQSMNNLKTLLERLANNTSADGVTHAVKDIYRDVDKDAQFRDWFNDVGYFIQKCLKKDGFVMGREATDEYNQLYQRGDYLLRDRYRDHIDRLINEIQFFFEQFSEDPDTLRFSNAVQKFFNDLGSDKEGNAKFKMHLLKDITDVIVPDILENVRYVPIPRIEYTDKAFDAVIENLVLESDNLMPNTLEIKNDMNFKFDRKSNGSRRQHAITVAASHIQCDLKDVSYYVKRKQGFPSITDTGVVDVFLGGNGLSFKLALSTADKKDRAHFFKIDSVKINMKKLKIKVKQSNHKALFSIFKPLLLKLLRPVLLKAFEQQIRAQVGRFDNFCYRIYQEEQKAEKEFLQNPDPETAKNMYARYYEAFQKEILTRKEKAREKVADKKANMAVTNEDSMFKDIKLPGGISTRATDLKKKAAEGDKWRSSVFTIGSAKPTGAHQPPKVTRKSPPQRRPFSDAQNGSHRNARDSGVGHENYAPERNGSSIPGYAQNGQNGQYNNGLKQAQGYQPSAPVNYA